MRCIREIAGAQPGLTVEDIAALTGQPAETVKATLAYHRRHGNLAPPRKTVAPFVRVTVSLPRVALKRLADENPGVPADRVIRDMVCK